MIYRLLIFTPLLFLSCVETHRGNKVTDENFPPHPKLPKNTIEIPEGAVTADFLGNHKSFYAYVGNIDRTNEITSIYFENENIPTIDIPESRGATLKNLKFKNFDRDLLLVNAKLKDSSFNEYYLYIWNDTLWKQVVSRFDIHKSNMSDTLVPIQLDPKDSNKVLRYYSVFDLDRASGKRFQWRLLRESVEIEKK